MTYLTAAQVAQVAKDAGWTGQDLVTSVAVCQAESSGWVEAVNPANGVYPPGSPAPGSRDFGLWQIDAKGLTHPELFDPATNAAKAHAMFLDRGWKPWVAYTSGSYRSRLEAASVAVASLSYPPIHISALQPKLRNEQVREYQTHLRAVPGLAQYNPSGATGYYGTETAAMTHHAYTDVLHLGGGDLNTPGPTLLAYLKFHPLP
jgi:hypothetical protein